MTRRFTETNSVEAVNERMAPATNARLREIMVSLVRHLHGFVREVALTPGEWTTAIDFLTRTGQICSAERQEFILLSDTLGVSMLVDAIANRRPKGATETTVLGPFHVAGAPRREMGENMALDGRGESCRYSGRVLDLAGRPIAGAQLDIWSDNDEGFYDVQQPETQPQWNNRGIFVTGADGCFDFLGIKPVPYSIPHDGPVGEMLTALGRHPWRPAHLHIIVSAPGFKPLTTHIFAAGDAYLESDAVFGVKNSLIVRYETSDETGILWRVEKDLILSPCDLRPPMPPPLHHLKDKR
jgi:catechol 1,2-dioxygenase